MEGRGPVHFREVKPKDYYFIQLLKNGDYTDQEITFSILNRLLLGEDGLEELTIPETRSVFVWAMENIISSKVMTVEQWMESAYHLCKQRWDSSIEWLEEQPVPKILLMIDITNKAAKEQEAAMKKAGRRK